jgi:5-methyltetrahydrofolate--homocysteine methyltransferase
VHADKILDTAEKEKADMIGLSGLITPSLDEMVHVAKEMKRRGMKQPLLIGGATTSRMHTAVKIAQQYDGGVVHVLDASRSVTVAGNLLNKEAKEQFLENINKEYEKLREDFANKKSAKQYIPFEAAQANAAKIDWTNYMPPKPALLGTKVFSGYDLNEIRQYIDWGPFFIAWEMKGKFPEILKDANVGVEATKLYNDANAMLDRIVNEKWLEAKGVIGFWEAKKIAPDTIVLKDEHGKELAHLESLRQQIKKAADQPNFSLSDFIRPYGFGGEHELADYMGAFAVSIHGIEPHLKRFMDDHDDYNKIMLQAMADRLAEAFAEVLHKRTRTEFWGYAKNEDIPVEDLVKEKYQGIRPAPGYPACPDHTEKYKLFDLLNATETAGIQLTESLAMYPGASVCGWYFSHPESHYFGIGKILDDQLQNYAQRKDMSIEDMSRWLSPILE